MNKGPSPHDPLASWADQTLKQLPSRQAPKTLAPRVMAVLARRQALPWYRQPWFAWPRSYQVLAAGLAAALIGFGLWWLWPHSETVSLASAKQAVSQFEAVQDVSVTAGILKSLLNALVLVLKSLNSWVLAAALGLFALIWSTTLGLGTACWRLANGPR